jgi:hypothetical protein
VPARPASRRPRRPGRPRRTARRACTASAICRAVSTSMRGDSGGVSSATGPATASRARPPRPAPAIAKPCLPDERLAITRTGSIGSCVGPAVTRTCACRQAHARRPASAVHDRGRNGLGSGSGPAHIRRTPSRLRRARSPARRPLAAARRCAAVAACCHMRTFIAGATSTGLSVARSRVVARSSAMPPPSSPAGPRSPGRRHQVRLRGSAGYGPSRPRP